MFAGQTDPATAAVVEKLADKAGVVKDAFRKFASESSLDVVGQGSFLPPPQPYEAFNVFFGTNLTEEQYLEALNSAIREENNALAQRAEESAKQRGAPQEGNRKAAGGEPPAEGKAAPLGEPNPEELERQGFQWVGPVEGGQLWRNPQTGKEMEVKKP
jgi:hypothetical protein